MTDIILDRLRTERQLAENGGHPILARSFDLAIAEIERMRAALEQIRGFAAVMSADNWRDLRLHIDRQCDVLNEQLRDGGKE